MEGLGVWSEQLILADGEHDTLVFTCFQCGRAPAKRTTLPCKQAGVAV